MKMVEMPGTEFDVKADLVLLAMGFGSDRRTLDALGVERDAAAMCARMDDYRTSVPKVFAAGDARRGQSLVVWAIREGRQCARGRLVAGGQHGVAALASMSAVVTLDLEGWLPTLTDEARERVSRALEEGGVIRLPRVGFALMDSERRFLSPSWSDGRAKNISVDGAQLKGAVGGPADRAELAAMISRFAAAAAGLVTALFPRYAPYVKRARSSYRPQGAVGRDVSWRKDDSRLHVDAFPRGRTTGAHPARIHQREPDEDRVWRVGEPFEAMAKTLLPRISDPVPGASALLAALRVTKGRRSVYDHLMLNLHDRAKADLAYQRDCPQETVHFAPGTTWICFSDQVMHAAVSGQFMLEQTIHLPVSALYDPARSPLAILERLTGRPLVAAQ